MRSPNKRKYQLTLGDLFDQFTLRKAPHENCKLVLIEIPKRSTLA